MSEPRTSTDPAITPGSTPGSGPRADAWGVQQTYVAADETTQRVDDDVVARLREVIGTPPDDLDDTAPVVTRPGRSTGLRGRVTCEDGSERDLDDVLEDDFPLGYHRLAVQDGPERRLVVSPGRCWTSSEQRWGWAVQLYAVWSRRSAGLGDLGDLRALREWTQEQGGGFLVVNPLHAVAPVLPLEASPYLPATRRYRNPVYLSLHDVPGCDPGADQAPAGSAVDRDAAWEFKRTRLRATYDAGLAPESAEALAAYRDEHGEDVEVFATWMVLAAEHGADWHDWPAELHDPAGAAVARVREERAEDVSYEVWLQWLLARQLADATGDLTVVQDLPIGVSGGGADAWAWQGVMADGVTVGAPPDALNGDGQDWGSPPLVPWRLRAADYEPFVQAVRASIAGAGGLRIDHVMGLFRLWWIPDGEGATSGCYVRYPADDMLDIVCLESHRAQAVVIGEDLGVVEDGVGEALAERGILSYKVLWFEDEEPEEWPTGSLATVTTHDLPTVPGLWTGSDMADQRAAGVQRGVESGRDELLARLTRDGLATDAPVAEAVATAYARLGRSPSLLLALSLEDALGEERRPNVPGTTARDNWRIPLPLPLEEVVTSAGPAAVVAALRG